MNAAQIREELSPHYYFPHLPEFRHAFLFWGLNYVWEAVANLEEYILSVLSGEIAPPELKPPVSLADRYILSALSGGVASAGRAVSQLEGARLITPGGTTEKGRVGILSSEGYILCREDIFLEGLSIAIGAGTIIEPGVVVKSPTIIGRKAELRQGAYIRGSVIIGDGAVVGHTTEVKNSVFMDHAEAGHFAYVGDSILGRRVNLGAGTVLANLEFRSPREKESHIIRPITITIDGEPHPTGLEKLGAILGDNVETGCNSVTSPGVMIGHGSWVYANTTVRKGVYGQEVIIRDRDGKMEVFPRRRP